MPPSSTKVDATTYLMVFIVHGDERDRIVSMSAYWDNAAWFTMLSKTSLA